jgi:hypothetical protein
MAWGGALVLVLSASGIAAAASLAGDTRPAEDTVPVVTTDTTATFEDANGDGVDDDCQDGEVADLTAAFAAMLAADLDHDGTLSVSEAAQTDWVGGANCNHGGYVSSVAHDSGEDCESGTSDGSTETPDGSTEAPDGAEQGDEGAEDAAEAPEADAGDCSTDSAESTTDATDTTQCETTTPEEAPAPADEQTPTDVAPNAHGKAVAEVAQSDAVGGKNCNHGGAVSEAAHQDHGQHGNAAKHAGQHGKGHGKGHGKQN